MTYHKHISVLKNEVLEFLTDDLKVSSPLFADLTFGGGGHTLGLIEKVPHAKVLAFDQDDEAYQNGISLIKEKNLKSQVTLVHQNFIHLASYPLENKKLDGILIDLGVSSHHFDSPHRGFSFKANAPLDMRMNTLDPNLSTAQELVNTLDLEELTRIFQDYGEEKFAKKIAAKILEERKMKPIQTTLELEKIIFHTYPQNLRHKGIHPATRVFQALRIAVNKELDVLSQIIQDAAKLLNHNGKLAIISFHSLEDRIVKHSFKNLAQDSTFQILTKRPILPTQEEICENFRARSAKLRVLQHK